MDYSFLRDKNVAVLGMGVEGIALTSFLCEKVKNITVLDIKTEKELLELIQSKDKETLKKIILDKKINSVFSDGYMDNLNKYDIIFRSPGISVFDGKIIEAKKAGVEISSQIKLFFDICPCEIIGVTGTKGKGTTSSLISEILKKNITPLRQGSAGQEYQSANWRTNYKSNVYLAGNIGEPAITLIPKLKPEDWVVLELSSFQLMDLEKSPNIAVITNLLIDHLNYHKTENEYWDSKLNIITHQKMDDFAIINLRAEKEFHLSQKTKARILFFSSECDQQATAYIKKETDDSILIYKNDNKEEPICRKSQIHLLGDHNLENIAAAVLVSRVIGVPLEIIKKVVQEFKGLPHRLEFIAKINSIDFINDSFATNPEPTMAAIKAISNNKILILGGSSKGADFTEMVREIVNSNVSGVVLIGDEKDNIEKELLKNKFSGKIIIGAKTMKEIVDQSISLAKPNDTILLSPACASFGLFKDYKDRGGQFREEVEKLKS